MFAPSQHAAGGGGGAVCAGEDQHGTSGGGKETSASRFSHSHRRFGFGGAMSGATASSAAAVDLEVHDLEATSSWAANSRDGGGAAAAEKTPMIRSFVDGFVTPFMNCVQPPIQNCVAPAISPPWEPPSTATTPCTSRCSGSGSRSRGRHHGEASSSSHSSPASRRARSVVHQQEGVDDSTSYDCYLNNVSKPHENDCLCGRGWSKNPGNRRFRDLVVANTAAYPSLTKRQKISMAKEIVYLIRNQDPPGRFLARDSRNGLWSDIGTRAVEKTAQALRATAAGSSGGSSCCSSSSTASDTAATASTARDGSNLSCITPQGSDLGSSSSAYSYPSSPRSASSRDSSKMPPEVIVPPHLESSFANVVRPSEEQRLQWMSHPLTTTASTPAPGMTIPSVPPVLGDDYVGSPPPYLYAPSLETVTEKQCPLPCRRHPPPSPSSVVAYGTAQVGVTETPPRVASRGCSTRGMIVSPTPVGNSGSRVRTMPASFYMPTAPPSSVSSPRPVTAPQVTRAGACEDWEGGATAQQPCAFGGTGRLHRGDRDATPPRSNTGTPVRTVAVSRCYNHHDGYESFPRPRMNHMFTVSPERQSSVASSGASSDWSKRVRMVASPPPPLSATNWGKRQRGGGGGGSNNIHHDTVLNFQWEEDPSVRDGSMCLSSTEDDEDEHLRGSSISLGSSSLSQAMQNNLTLEDRVGGGQNKLELPLSPPCRRLVRRRGSGEEDGRAAMSVTAFLRLDD